MKTEKELIKEIEEQRVMLQTYLASDMDIDKMDYDEVINYAIADVNDQNIFLGHWKDYAFLRGQLEGIQSERARIKEKIKRLREPLADLEHQQWVHLIDFLMEYNNSEGNIMDKLNSYEERGLLTEYTYLTEKDKEKDRVWADKVIKELLKVLKEK